MSIFSKEPNDYDEEQWRELQNPRKSRHFPEQDPDEAYDRSVYESMMERETNSGDGV